MAMDLFLRQATAEDWPAILELADAALPWDRKGNREWLENRRRFAGPRRHYLVTGADDGRSLGYGAIEEGPEPGRYRIFLVMAPALLATGVAALLTQHLDDDLHSLEAQAVWAREYARDTALLAFFRRDGFVERQRFTLPGLPEMVVLERDIASPIPNP